MSARLVVAGLALLGLACAAGPADPPARVVPLLFGANLDGTGRCTKTSLEGCDIWLAQLDLDHGVVGVARAVARTVGVAEDFPALDPNGRWAWFGVKGRGGHRIDQVDLQSGARRTVSEQARAPVISQDGTLLAFQSESHGPGGSRWDLHGRVVSPESGAAEEDQRWTTSEVATEPILLPDGRRVAYYAKGGGRFQGRFTVRDLQTGAEEDFGAPDGCSHGSVSPDGRILFCQRAEQLYARELSDGSWGPLTRHSYPDPGDPAYSSCPDLTFGHAEFCGDSATVLATYGCKRGEEEGDAQLYLFRWDGPVVALVSRQVSAALGATGGTARSGVCGVEPAG